MFVMDFWLQLKLLLWKNFITKKRKPFVLFVETIILLTFFFIFAIVRIAEQPVAYDPQRFRAYPLFSAGIIPVLQELCSPPENEMDDNGFFPKNSEGLQKLLEIFIQIDSSQRYFSLDVSPEDVEGIPATFKSIAENSGAINDIVKALPDATISDVLRNPQATRDYFGNILSIPNEHVEAFIRSPFNVTEITSRVLKKIGEVFMSRQTRSVRTTRSLNSMSGLSTILSGISNLAQRTIYDTVKSRNDVIESFCNLHPNAAKRAIEHLLDNLNYDLLHKISLFKEMQPLSFKKDLDRVIRNIRVLLILKESIQKIATLVLELQNLVGTSLLQNFLNCDFGNVSPNVKLVMKNVFNVSIDNTTRFEARNHPGKETNNFGNHSNMLTSLFSGKMKILYAPTNSDVDKIIEQVNKTIGLSGLEMVTRYAVSFKKIVVEMENYLRIGYTANIEKGTRTIAGYLELDSELERDLFSKKHLMKHLRVLDTVASAWLHFVSQADLDFFIGFQDEISLLNYVQNQAQKENVKVFAGLSFVMNGDGSLPQHVTYSIRQNASFFANTKKMKYRHRYNTRITRSVLYYYSGFVFLQDLIDRAIVSLHSGRDVVEPGNYVQELPLPCYSHDKLVESLEHMLPLCAVFSWVFVLAILVQNIVREKEYRLKEVMKAMGMSELVHTLSWFLVSLLFVTVSCFLMMAIVIFGAVLPNCEASLIFTIFLLYGISIIAFSFLLSSFFSKAKVASACAGIIYFLMYVPSIYVGIQSEFNNEPVSLWSMAAAFLICPTTFSRIMTYVVYYEEMGTGAKWSNWNVSPVDNDTITLKYMIMFLPLDTLLYLVIMWYINNVCPGVFGLPRRWNFPFTKSYWMDCFVFKKHDRSKNYVYDYSLLTKASSVDHKLNIAVDDDIFMNEYRKYFELEPENLIVGVRIDHLGKSFGNLGKNMAVRDLSLNFYQDHITAFLGHNGAGKTTTISMLTGILPPSSGSATIYGLDIRHDMDKIRQNLGICPQHNVLFNELTVEEHIQFYACLKGVSANNLADEIERIIDDAELFSQRKEAIACLGGGMKRKLSVAIAFIGGSKTVILDEPTSGIDPCSRRAIWDLILKYRKGRTIILSTHHMDEAETLGDRVAVIASGRLQCCGSPVHLKNNLGFGYHLYLARQTTSPIALSPSQSPASNLSINQSGKFCNIITTGEPCKPNSSWGIAVTSFVQDLITTAQFVSESMYELHYVLPISELKNGNYERLFSALDGRLVSLNVASYGVRSPTLEEVFLHVSSTNGQIQNKSLWLNKEGERIRNLSEDDEPVKVKRMDNVVYQTKTSDANWISSTKKEVGRLRKRRNSYQRLPIDDEVEIDDMNEDEYEPGFGGIGGSKRVTLCRIVPLLQICAIIEKRYLCTRRNKKGLMSQIILPAIFVAIAMAVALIVPSFDDPPPLDLSMRHYMNVTQHWDQNIVFSNSHQDEDIHVQHRVDDDARSSLLESTLLLPSGLGAACVLKSRHTNQHSMGFSLTKDSFESSCMEAIPDENLFNIVNDRLEMEAQNKTRTNLRSVLPDYDRRRYHPTCQCAGTLSRNFICSGNYENPPTIRLLTGERLLNISGHKEMEYFLYTQDLYREHRYGALSFGIARNNVPASVGSDSSYICKKLAVRHTAKGWYDSTGFHAMPILVNALNNAILRANLPAEKGNPAAYGITTINHPLPNTNSLAQYENLLMGTNLVIAIFVITAMAFVPASFVLHLVHERQSKAKHLHLVAGVSPFVYWTGNFIWDLINYLIPALCCLMILLLFGISAYTSGSNFTAVLLLFLLYGWAMTPAMYPFSFHFEEPSVAFLFLVVLNLFLGLTCLTTVLTLMMETKHQLLLDISVFLDNLFIIFPNYCLGKGLMDLAILDYKNFYYMKIGKPELVRSIFSWKYIPKKLVAMAVSGVIFFCVTLLCERMTRKRPRKLDGGGDARKGILDEDVATENQRVLQGGAKNDALQLVNLTKVYDGKKSDNHIAVDNICVGIPKGECFGLVGVNGAGKTTTFLMLTGGASITSGDALLNGNSVGRDFDTARRDIGYCPQFDALYDELTAREHLTMYSCFHGISRRRQKKVVDWALRKLDLMSYSDQQTHTFSGGTKRKLSTALALLGNPAVIFLDEPTTGMDPRSKRFLWDVILGVVRGVQGQSVLLTTHSMEECEALCDRLTVMVDGRFCCLGSVQYLKARFGGGYSLSIRLRNDGGRGNTAETGTIAGSVDDFISNSFPNAILKKSHSNILHYELKSSDVSLSYIFSCLEEALTRLEVEDYSICQNTLDNVFINFVKEQSSSG